MPRTRVETLGELGLEHATVGRDVPAAVRRRLAVAAVAPVR